jgi:hypothetical protein
MEQLEESMTDLSKQIKQFQQSTSSSSTVTDPRPAVATATSSKKKKTVTKKSGGSSKRSTSTRTSTTSSNDISAGDDSSTIGQIPKTNRLFEAINSVAAAASALPNLALEHRAYILFAVSAVGIYLVGDYASV